MRVQLLVVFVASAFAVVTADTRADTPVVYDGAVGPDGTRMLNSGDTTLNLHIDLGPLQSSETPCEDGTGDELCAAEVIVEIVTGPAEITGFAEGTDVVMNQNSSTVLRLNLLQSINPPSPPGPQDLGAVTITTDSNSNERITVQARGQVVDAGGGLVSITTRTIAIPEPSGAWQMATGLLGLAGLRRRRGRRARARRREVSPGACGSRLY